jgi:hypothetical protein
LGQTPVNGATAHTDWNTVDWRRAERRVRNLRQRIFRASQQGDHCKAASLQNERRRNDPLEPCAGKLARTVLRGRGHSDVSLLPGEMIVTIAGKKHYLWRAVDQDGFVLEAGLSSDWGSGSHGQL